VVYASFNEYTLYRSHQRTGHSSLHPGKAKHEHGIHRRAISERGKGWNTIHKLPLATHLSGTYEAKGLQEGSAARGVGGGAAVEQLALDASLEDREGGLDRGEVGTAHGVCGV
jgi:hypothetical protein